MKTSVSLSEVHRTVSIPKGTGILKRMFAFFGPAYLVSVGYMDPGNWATDLEGGSKFGYTLIWVSAGIQHSSDSTSNVSRKAWNCYRQRFGAVVP